MVSFFHFSLPLPLGWRSVTSIPACKREARQLGDPQDECHSRVLCVDPVRCQLEIATEARDCIRFGAPAKPHPPVWDILAVIVAVRNPSRSLASSHLS
ncbi:hypothetical protein HDV63DRAFT_365432 [Trichoderma sp. SZMC 28014]